MTLRAALGLAPFLLAACGSTTVTVELTDAPPDMASLAHVEVTLSRVEVHVAGADTDDDADEASDDDKAGDKSGDDDDDDDDGAGAGWRTVTAEAGTFDLVALQNDVRTTLGSLELPDGKITQIRLFLDPNGKNQVELTSGEICPLDLDAVPPTGVKINHPFKALDVEDSSKLKLVVDFDLKESLDQTATCAFALKPVIKLKRIERD